MLGILRDCDRLGSRSLPSQSLMEENWQETSGRGIGLGKKFEWKIKRLGDGKGNQGARIVDGYLRKRLGDHRKRG